MFSYFSQVINFKKYFVSRIASTSFQFLLWMCDCLLVLDSDFHIAGFPRMYGDPWIFNNIAHEILKS